LNTTHSIADYFLSYANPNPRIGQGGILLNTLDTYNFGELSYADQQAFIGYQTYMISPDTNSPDNNTYYNNVPSGSYYQENYLESTGYNGKVAFNASAQYKDFLSIGLNINSHFTDYVQTTTFYEDNNNSATTGVRNFALTTICIPTEMASHSNSEPSPKSPTPCAPVSPMSHQPGIPYAMN
jgi:hypothetical protein